MYFIRYILWFFYDKITKEVKPVLGDIKLIAGQWHLNHFAVSFIPVALLLIFGFPKDYIFIPCIIISVIFLISELKQTKGNWKNPVYVKDFIADTNLYQGCWVVYGWIPFTIISIIYLITLIKGWIRP